MDFGSEVVANGASLSLHITEISVHTFLLKYIVQCCAKCYEILYLCFIHCIFVLCAAKC